nr:MAG TPA: hypothetical protein [Caudoviricetes sp.]
MISRTSSSTSKEDTMHNTIYSHRGGLDLAPSSTFYKGVLA